MDAASPHPDHHLPCIEFDRDDLLVRLDVTIPGDPAAISPLVDRVIEMVKSMECAAGKEFEIETGLREALANAIRHGCRHDLDRGRPWRPQLRGTAEKLHQPGVRLHRHDLSLRSRQAGGGERE